MATFLNMKRVTAPKKYLPIESFEKEITELIFYILEVYCFRTKHALDTSDTEVKTIRELESLNRQKFDFIKIFLIELSQASLNSWLFLSPNFLVV